MEKPLSGNNTQEDGINEDYRFKSDTYIPIITEEYKQALWGLFHENIVFKILTCQTLFERFTQ